MAFWTECDDEVFTDFECAFVWAGAHHVPEPLPSLRSGLWYPMSEAHCLDVQGLGTYQHTKGEAIHLPAANPAAVPT